VNITATTAITATAPDYAPDGSRGYFLEVTRGWRVTGWIYAEGHTVYATIDRAPWQHVGTVASPAELTPAWVAKHAEAIVKPF
jgi:hypothetical protein